jgi:hypothetical protein
LGQLARPRAIERLARPLIGHLTRPSPQLIVAPFYLGALSRVANPRRVGKRLWSGPHVTR